MTLNLTFFFTIILFLSSIKTCGNGKSLLSYASFKQNYDTLRHPRPRDHGFYGLPKGRDGSTKAGAQSAEARGLPSRPEGGP
jgi:hypothetical protein